jgi:hypothetical protein
MVEFNRLSKSDGNTFERSKIKKPKNILFEVGNFDVSVHKKPRVKVHSYAHVGIWNDKDKIGGLDLYKIYTDVNVVFSVDARIDEKFQGRGIGYRVYEGLVCENNLSLQSSHQSVGAIKMWQRFATNRGLQLYFIDDTMSENLFECDVFRVKADKNGFLEGTDYKNMKFNPYKKRGSLLLVKKKNPLHSALQKHMIARKSAFDILGDFKKYDIPIWK